MAFTMTKTLSYRQSAFFTGPNAPLNPYENLYWKNTSDNTLREYRKVTDSDNDGILDTFGWAIVTNYDDVNTLLESTVNNTTFQGILENAQAIQAAAAYATPPEGQTVSMLDQVAAFLRFGSPGLDVLNVNKDLFSRMATSAFELHQLLGAVDKTVASFGILKAITGAQLQIGPSNSGGTIDTTLDSQLNMGTFLLQYDAETGHITCRKG